MLEQTDWSLFNVRSYDKSKDNSLLASSSQPQLQVQTIISLTKLFQSSQFFLNFFFVIPYEQSVKLSAINIAINNKLVDSAKYLNNIARFETTCSGTVLAAALKNQLVLEETKNYKVISYRLRPELIGTNFNDLENITVTFQNSDRRAEVNYVQIRRRSLNNNSYVINKNNDETLILQIPYFWQFNFPLTQSFLKTHYTNLTIKTNELNRLQPTRQLLTSQLKVNLDRTSNLFNTENNTNASINKLKDFYKFSWPQYYGTPYYEFKEFVSSIGYQTTSLHTTFLEKDELNDQNELSELKSINLDSYFTYDSGNKTVIESSTAAQPGLIIPYSQANNITNSYLLAFNYQNLPNSDNWLKVLINDTFKIERPLLDKEQGLIKLDILSEGSSTKEFFRYVLNLDDAELFVNKIFADLSQLDQWRNKTNDPEE
ncbi:MHO_1580 family protein [Mycoplasmopsis columbinasalis]|uniref:MHO_1580 family protein n=1 Tax=Mycoplasmopsis columbinasalis TaxID=114880 RepID=UPI00101D6FDC|nr:hypothetical protein [Mycoplasmopsis columbinasalis]